MSFLLACEKQKRSFLFQWVLWAIFIFVLPFQHFLSADNTDFYVLYAVLAGGLFLSERGAFFSVGWWRDPLFFILFTFFAFLSLREGVSDFESGSHDGLQDHKWIKPFYFLLMSPFCYLAGDLMVRRFGRSFVQRVLGASILIGGCLSFLYIYLPFPPIFDHAHFSAMRLTGFAENPNQCAKLFSIAILMPYIALSAGGSSLRAMNYVLLVVFSVFLAATASKAALLGLAACIFVTGFLFRLSLSWVKASGVVLLSITVWLGFCSFPIEMRAAEIWSHEPTVNIETSSYIKNFIERERYNKDRDFLYELRHSLRVGESAVMQKVGDTVIYSDRAYSLLNTGQRDRLWNSGLDIVQKNWILGIGVSGWEKEMFDRLGYPFASPHNSFLDVTGTLGLLGLVLYLGLYSVGLRRAQATDWISYLWLCCFVIELFDYMIPFGGHNASLIFWLAAGMQRAAFRKDAIHER